MFKPIALAVLLSCLSLPLMADELRLYTEENRPFTYLEGGRPHGMTVQVVEELARRLGVPAQIEMVPWTRGYHQVRQQPDTALFPVVRTAQREDHFQWVGPIAVGRTGFYSRRSDHLRVRNLKELAQMGTLAVPKQWYSHEVLAAKGLKNLYGVATPADMLRLFHHGRVKLIIANDLSLDAMLAEQGMSVDEVQWQFDLMPTASYIAFSPQTSPTRVAQWRAQLQSMRVDGTLERFYRQWFPQATEEEVNELIGR
ncbi:ABC transporter substrate-binding protein [Pseudomonas sp. 8Z]|uniref:substrate-binding periplasmic protein n=1 Tax=Pseudomonas sp. 8Z TaxID=2653166 RepID=UPI0012EFFFB8|nr:transporter substrate-binding domain-containing protein [Pseudomonas sp. 8Z]VXC18853.1 ABC transporter substrate-binding protein [Pseudomonas sp. 8Z]